MVSGIREVWVKTAAGRRIIGFAQDCANGHAEQFDASVMSDGTLRSLGILLALRQKASTRRSFCWIRSRIRCILWHGVLLDAIDKASEEFPIVVSTHSPGGSQSSRRPGRSYSGHSAGRWGEPNLRFERRCSGESETAHDGRPVAPFQRSLDPVRSIDGRSRRLSFSSPDGLMAKYIIVPIVEGRGEVEALPILVRNWLRFRRYKSVEVHLGPFGRAGRETSRFRTTASTVEAWSITCSAIVHGKQLPSAVVATSLSADFCKAKGPTLASYGLEPVDPGADQMVIAFDIAPTAGDANEGELRK